MSKISLSSVAIVAARVLLLGLAGGAVLAALLIARKEHAHGVDPGGAYLCPMHPDVTSAAPGDCPVCSMALELRKTGDVHGGSGVAADGLTFQIPPTAAITKFDDVGYGKMLEMAREMRGPAWVESGDTGRALFYKDEVALLGPTEEALFFPSTQPTQASAPVKVRRIEGPAVEWDRSTSLIRFRVSAKAALAPGKTGSIKFEARTRDTLVVRTPAVVQSPTGPYVFLLAKDNRTLTKRAVEIGAVRMGHAAVLSGLAVGERIAAQGTFFLDAERRFAETAP
jgi:hypothetical protein